MKKQKEVGSRITSVGDKNNGYEVRYQDGELDELVIYSNGQCVFHLEQMSNDHWWMRAHYDKDGAEESVDINLTSLRKIYGRAEENYY